MNDYKFCLYCGNKLIRRHIENYDRFYCENCEKVIYKNSIPASAAIITNSDKEILLVKRKKEPHVNSWCLPGGFIEFGEDPREATLRELEEETNLIGKIIELYDVLPDISPLYGPVLLVSYVVEIVNGKMAPGDDASDVKYFGKDEIPTVIFKSHKRIINEVLLYNCN